MKQSKVFALLNNKYVNLSKKHKIVADFVLNNYDKAAFMTAKKISEAVNISESTVVRFSKKIGYEGFPEFQEDLRDSIKRILTTKQKLYSKVDMSTFEDSIKSSFEYDINSIKKTMSNIDFDALKKAVDTIMSSKSVYILGLRSSKVLADYFSFYLNFFHENVKSINHGASDIIDQLINLKEGDMLICISFPRYSNQILEYAKIINDKGIKLLALTDSIDSPIVEFSTHFLLADYSIDSFIDSHVSPMSLINAIVMAIAQQNQDLVNSKFQKLEDIWLKYNVYL